MQENNFETVAVRISKARRKAIVIIVIVTAILVAGFCNYFYAGFSVKPDIVLYENHYVYDNTEVTVYISLGFKQVVYESDYGRNYSERLFCWEKVEKEPNELSSEQYNCLCDYLGSISEDKSSKYLESYSTFDACIFYVEKKSGKYYICLGGKNSTYYKYNGEIYNNIEGDYALSEDVYNAWDTYMLECEWNGKEFTEINTIDAYTELIPKGVVRKINTHIDGEILTADVIKDRSLVKACAHFGCTPSIDNCIDLNESDGTLQIYMFSKDMYESETLNPIKTVKLKGLV